MRHIKYVTDNPYRLLQISSCVTLKELRKAAVKTDKFVQVDQFTGAGLERVFGSDEITHCLEIVSSLANNPHLRTLYRLFWPFLYERPLNADDTLQDLNRLIDRYDNPAIFHVVHLCFLKQWFTFLDQQTPSAARLAFLDFQELYEDVACDEYLIELLKKEGADAQHLRDAQYELIAHLLDTVCQQAIEQWQTGKVEQVTELLTIVCSSPFDKDAIHQALRPVSLLGERERQKICTALENYKGWEPKQGIQEIKEAQNLQQLAQCVHVHLAVAGLWRETVDQRVEQVATCMRNYAIDLANEQKDWHGCKTILTQMQMLSLPEEWEKTLHDDLKTLADNQKAEDRQRLYAVIQPIKDAPTLRTINGIGTKLYGRKPFDTESGAYLSTLYFVFAFIPLFPIARYLVKDAPGGGWYFQGRTFWSRSNKIHLAISCALLLGFIGWINYPSKHPSSSYPENTTYNGQADAVSNSSLSTPSYAISSPITEVHQEKTVALTTTGSPLLQVDAAVMKRKDKLRAEEKQLTERIHRSDADLSVRKADIEQSRLRLEAMEQELNQTRQSLQTTSEDIDAQRLILDHSDEAAVAMFNAKVTQFNADQNGFNVRVRQYKQNQQDFNEAVNSYNAAVHRNNSNVQRLKEIVHALEHLEP